MSKRIVSVTLSVEVDTDAWTNVYGETATPTTVKEYVVNQIAQCAAADDGAITSARLGRKAVA